MPVEDFIFQETGDGSYVRKLFGVEIIMAHMTCVLHPHERALSTDLIPSETLEGCTHLTLSASVTVPPGLPKGTIERKVREAWIALRHQVPTLACRTFRTSDTKQQFAFRYNVPRSKDEGDAWATETAFFKDEPKSLIEWNQHLKVGNWWFVSSNRYCAELHVSPMAGENEWHFSISSVHSNGDGRGLFMVLEVFLDILTMALEAENDITENLVWGDEIVRLTPPAPFVHTLVASGKPPSIPDVIAPPPQDTTEPSHPLWVYPLAATGKKEDIARLVKFSTEDTQKIFRATKAHGRTVTQVLSALIVLAYAESVLIAAGKEGEERFQEVSSSYETATHHNIVLNPWDQRIKLPGGYDSFRSPNGSPLLSFISSALLVPIDGLKKLLVLDKERRVISKTTDLNAFWNSLVQGVADTWERVDTTIVNPLQQTSLESYLPSSLALHGIADNGYFIPPDVFNGPHTLISSFGDFDRLNVLSTYLPSETPTAGKPLTVTDTIFCVRTRMDCCSCFAFTIKGELSCHFSTTLDHHTSEEFEGMISAFVDWATVLFV